MDVVSPELNSLLPDEIMDTESIVIEDLPSEPPMASGQGESEAPVPMETEVPEIISMSAAIAPTQRTLALTTSTSTDSALCSISSGTQLLLTPSGSAALKPSASTAAVPAPVPAPVATPTSSPGVSGGLQKLTAPFTISANHQIILNKVAASSAVDAKSSGAQVLKQEGQKLVVATLGKAGQPIVLTLPHAGTKASPAQGSGDSKAPPQQYKVVTIGGRTDLKPVMGVQPVSTASQLLGTSQHSTLQTQQLKTIQVGALLLPACVYDGLNVGQSCTQITV